MDRRYSKNHPVQFGHLIDKRFDFDSYDVDVEIQCSIEGQTCFVDVAVVDCAIVDNDSVQPE